MFRAHQQQIGVAATARAGRHDLVEERTDRGRSDAGADASVIRVHVERVRTPDGIIDAADAAIGAGVGDDGDRDREAVDRLAAIGGAVAVKRGIHGVHQRALGGVEIGLHHVEDLAFALIVEDFFQSQRDRNRDHLGREVGVVEQLDGSVVQEIEAVVPLRIGLIDLERFTDAGTRVRFPVALALEGGEQRVVVGHEVLIARSTFLQGHRKHLLISSHCVDSHLLYPDCFRRQRGPCRV